MPLMAKYLRQTVQASRRAPPFTHIIAVEPPGAILSLFVRGAENSYHMTNSKAINGI